LRVALHSGKARVMEAGISPLGKTEKTRVEYLNRPGQVKTTCTYFAGKIFFRRALLYYYKRQLFPPRQSRNLPYRYIARHYRHFYSTNKPLPISRKQALYIPVSLERYGFFFLICQERGGRPLLARQRAIFTGCL